MPRKLRIGTFNLQWGLPNAAQSSLPPNAAAFLIPPAERRAAFAATARKIAELKLDLLALQEVDNGRFRSARQQQTAYLAKELGMQGYFVPVARSWKPVFSTLQPLGEEASGTYGISLLSRYPVRQVYSQRLAEEWQFWRRRENTDSLCKYRVHITEPRRCVYAEIAVPGFPRPLLFASTHLSTEPRAGMAQLAEAAAGFAQLEKKCFGFRKLAGGAELPAHGVQPAESDRFVQTELSAGTVLPAILAGDFNMRAPSVEKVRASSPYMQDFAPESSSLPTYPAATPRYPIDHILGRGVKISYQAALPFAISDHCLLLAEASLEDSL